MSLLEHESESLDTAARGEEYTKGSGHLIWAAIVATVLVTIAIGLYVWLGQKPPTAIGEIEQITSHALHTETSGLDASGAPMPKQIFDQMLIFTRVKLQNKSDKPLFLHQVMVNATLDDGIHTVYAASTTDYDRLFIAHPELASLRGNSLPNEATINPGQTLEGTFVSAFRMSKQQWDARKSLDFTFAFEYQPSLKIVPQGAIIEQ